MPRESARCIPVGVGVAYEIIAQYAHPCIAKLHDVRAAPGRGGIAEVGWQKRGIERYEQQQGRPKQQR